MRVVKQFAPNAAHGTLCIGNDTALGGWDSSKNGEPGLEEGEDLVATCSLEQTREGATQFVLLLLSVL